MNLNEHALEELAWAAQLAASRAEYASSPQAKSMAEGIAAAIRVRLSHLSSERNAKEPKQW